MTDSNQPQTEIPPDLRQITRSNLTTDLVRSLDKFFRPSAFALQGMIQSICARKGWPRSFLAAVLCINDSDLREWEYGKRTPPGCAVRLIWLLYTMDIAPEHAFSPLHFCTWGEIEKLPAQIAHGPSVEEKSRIVNELRACKESKYRLTPWRRTLSQLTRKYGIKKETLRRWCIEAGYLPAKKTYYKKKTKKLRIIQPGSAWLKADWRLKPNEIAEQVMASEFSVRNNRATLRKLPKAPLLRHLKACNVDLEKWEPILKYAKKISRKKTDNKFDTKSTEDNISVDEAKVESLQVNLQAEADQAGGCSDVRAEQEECNAPEPQEEVRGSDAGNQ